MSLDIGRRIERALLLIVLCRSSLVAVQDEWIEDLLLESVLAAAESLIYLPEPVPDSLTRSDGS